jgi:predicted Zn-dependent protease
MPFTQDDTRRILHEALTAGATMGGDCEASLEATTGSHTRFARNEITTSGLTDDAVLTITIRKDGRSGTVSTNDFAPEAIRAAAGRAEAMRATMPVDPEAVELLSKQDYPAIEKFDPACAAARAADRAGGVKAALAVAKKRGLTAAGFFESETVTRAIANSKGNFGHHVATGAEFSTTMRTGDATGSGWASSWSPALAAIDAKGLARTAADKGVASARPREIDPGDYTVVLEPAAVAALLQAFQFGGLSRRAADEGQSVFAKQGGGNRIGEAIFPESVTLVSDPFDPRLPATPWSGGGFFGGAAGAAGIPSRKVAWIEKGVLKTLFTDRYWARATRSEPTPFPSSLALAGGSATIDDLIASTERGLLVTRFWYIRAVNPQTAQLTGLTRDGLFLIEKGKIAAPVVNLRFNESPVVMLQNLEAMSAAVPAGRMLVPAIKSRAFTFTSKSDAV